MIDAALTLPRRRANGSHGHTPHGRMTVEYTAWHNLRSRCYDRNHDRFHRFGGRGVRVCSRWRDFAAFLSDVGVRPTPRHRLIRDDPDGHYEPGNVRWAVRSPRLPAGQMEQVAPLVEDGEPDPDGASGSPRAAHRGLAGPFLGYPTATYGGNR